MADSDLKCFFPDSFRLVIELSEMWMKHASEERLADAGKLICDYFKNKFENSSLDTFSGDKNQVVAFLTL